MPTAAFDVIGTLFSLDRLERELTRLGAPAGSHRLWLAQSLRDYFALSHAGGYAPLRAVLAAGLARVLDAHGVEPGDEGVERATGALTELDASPGAAEACAALGAAGWRLVAVSNGSREATEALLGRAGLRERFAAVRSCDEIGVSKPHPRVYELAREHAEGELWMVAAHAWDCAGAARAGLRTAWVAQEEGVWLEAYPPPDVSAPGLAEAARAMLGRA